MLYWLINSFRQAEGLAGSDVSFLNVFRYITFRSGAAALTAFLVGIVFGPAFIRLIQSKQFGQTVREDGPQSHLKKRGTPTMGGVLIVLALSFATLLWADLANPNVWFILLITWSFAAVGFLDDYIKIIRKDPKGLPSRWKFRLL